MSTAEQLPYHGWQLAGYLPCSGLSPWIQMCSHEDGSNSVTRELGFGESGAPFLQFPSTVLVVTRYLKMAQWVKVAMLKQNRLGSNLSNVT